MMHSNSLKPCITEPIRITSNFRPSLIDNIFTNMKILNSGNLRDKILGNMPNFVIAWNPLDMKKRPKIRIRAMKNFNYEKFLKDLEEIKVVCRIQTR